MTDIFLLMTTRKHRFWPHIYLQIAIEMDFLIFQKFASVSSLQLSLIPCPRLTSADLVCRWSTAAPLSRLTPPWRPATTRWACPRAASCCGAWRSSAPPPRRACARWSHSARRTRGYSAFRNAPTRTFLTSAPSSEIS